MPLEVGKTYKTKFATGEFFTITNINPKTPNMVYGVYEHSPNLGECPLSIDRIIPEKLYSGSETIVLICPKCKHETYETN